MFLGFDFDPVNAVAQCEHWLSAGEGLDLEYIESQRASIAGMLKHPHLLTVPQGNALSIVEKKLYSYLCENGGVSSPVLRDSALGGDLIHIPFDRENLGLKY
jgi:hypothetical protein